MRYDASSFNVIHLASMYKVDIFVAGPSQMDREQLRRKVRITLTNDPDIDAFVTAAENLVVRKLDWYRQTGETSERHWRDVLGILKVQAAALDVEYLRQLGRASGLEELLERAIRESTPDD